MNEKTKMDSKRLQEIEEALEALFGITRDKKLTLTVLETIHYGFTWVIKPSIYVKDYDHLQQLKKHLEVLGINIRFPQR